MYTTKFTVVTSLAMTKPDPRVSENPKLSFERVKTTRIRRLASEGAWIVFGQIATVIGALASVRLLTELLDPSAYGELGLGMTAGALINQVLVGPLSNGATRYYASAVERADIHGYIKAVYSLMVKSTAAIGIVMVCAIVGLLFSDFEHLVGISVAVFIFTVISGVNSLLAGIQNAARQRSVVAIHQAAETWAKLLFAAILINALNATSAVAVCGYVVGSALILLSQFWQLRKKIPFSNPSFQNNEWQYKIFRYSWPFGAWGIFTGLQIASDRWALGHFATTQEVGYYVVLYQLGYYPISMATGMAMQFLAPILYERAGDAKDHSRNENIRKITRQLTICVLMLTVFSSLIAFLFNVQIFDIFVATEYSSAAKLLPLIILSGGIFAAGQAITLNIMSLMKTEAMVRVKIITALMGVGLNCIGAYFYGAAGVVLAGVGFSLLYLIWMLIISRKLNQSVIFK